MLHIRIMKFYVLNISDVVGQGVDDSGVDAVLEAKGLGQNEGIVVGVDLDRGGLLWVELDHHLDGRLVTGGLAGGVGLDGGLVAELRV